MSNVLRRNRSIAEFAYVNKAHQIREEMVSILNNENIVPKRYKFSYVVPVMEMCRNLEHHAHVAEDCIGPETPDYDLYRRKKIAYMDMLDDIRDITNELQQMKRQFMKIKITRFDKIINMLAEERQLLMYFLTETEDKHVNFVLKMNTTAEKQ